MSWYVDYYIGYKTKEGKIYPLAPFDCFGNLYPIITKSGSFTSDLWKKFNRVTLEETTEALNKYFPKGNAYSWEESEEEKGEPPWCFWLPAKDLPRGSYLKKGYFLQEDISSYEKDEYFDGFYDWLTPDEYARKMESELKFGTPKPKKDLEGNEIEVYSCGDYSYYIYPDYYSEEYEASMIWKVLDEFEYSSKLPKDSELVVLQTYG